jgi:hypothetical protein
MSVRRGRRLRRMGFHGEFLLRLSSGIYRVMGNEMPADARAVGMTIEAQTGTIWVFVESREFEFVDEGDTPPVHKSPIVSRMEEVPQDPEVFDRVLNRKIRLREVAE